MNGSTLAIDPGANGGLAWTDGETVRAVRMPKTFGEVLSVICEVRPMRIVMEKVGGYINGNAGTSSGMFKFGEGVGFVEGVAMTLGIRLELVTPQRWQNALHLGHREKDQPKSDWKRKLKGEAERLFPTLHPTLMTSDALLILEYATNNASK